MAHVVKSFLGKPRCSECGSVVVRTYSAFPYPQWRCNVCCSRNKELEYTRKEIEDLKKKINA